MAVASRCLRSLPQQTSIAVPPPSVSRSGQWQTQTCAKNAQSHIRCDHLSAHSVIGGQMKHVTAVGRKTTSAVCGAGPEMGPLQFADADLV